MHVRHIWRRWFCVDSLLVDGADRAAGKRFDVYRNNVISSLKDAMSDSFPVIEKLLGPENFAALSDIFVRKHPPADPRMMHYGGAFPAFLEHFEPLQHLGYLPDVARLELAQRQSYHASDRHPLDPMCFNRFSAEDLASAKLTFAPAVQLVRSSWPILEIWHFNMTPDAPQPSSGAQDVLVTRSEFDPAFHALPPGGAELIADLQDGVTLGAALEPIEENYPDFDFSALLGLLLHTGALTALTPDSEQMPKRITP